MMCDAEVQQRKMCDVDVLLVEMCDSKMYQYDMQMMIILRLLVRYANDDYSKVYQYNMQMMIISCYLSDRLYC